MRLSDLLAPLLDAKVDHELIRQQIIAFEKSQSDALEQRRKADAERQARKRSRDVTLRHSDRVLAGAGDARVEDKTLTSEIEPQKEEKKETRGARSLAFEQFWLRYPNKVGKPKARAAFEVAVSKAELPAIMAGLDRYISAKPVDRAWLNPATFLNQERWADEPAAPPVARVSTGPPGTPRTAADFLLNETMERINGHSGSEASHRPDAGEFPGLSVTGTARRIGLPHGG